MNKEDENKSILPCVSIVVPVYNMESSIEKCVYSLLKQDYANYEIILVDDGSIDGSYNKCCALAKTEKKIKCYHIENQGSGPARNVGIEHSKGKYIYFPDADDELKPNAISILVEAISSDFCDLVVFGYQCIKKDGSVIGEKKYDNSIQFGHTIRQNYSSYLTKKSKWTIQGAPWNKFFDLDVIRKFNIKYPALRRHQDECFISLYMSHATKIRFINEVLYIYNVNSLTDEWRKYPINYFENVRMLYEFRKNTILKWNSEDKITYDLIQKEYVCNVIKSFELFFSPKHDFSFITRYRKIKDCVKQSELFFLGKPKSLPKYQSIILFAIKKKFFVFLYNVMLFKVFICKRIK